MGSIGVQTGSGRITSEQMSKLSDSTGAVRGLINKSNSIVVLPNKLTKFDKVKADEKKWRKVLGIDGGSMGYAVAMTGATPQQKQNFLKMYQKTANLTQNNDASFKRYVDKQLAKAQTWIRSQGRKSLSPAERKMVTALAQGTYQRGIIDRMVARDRRNGNKRFGGNIRTRSLRRVDFG